VEKEARRVPFRPGLALLLALIVAVAPACGERRHRDAPASGAAAARLLITRDLGGETLRSARVAPGQTVFAALEGVATVEAGYGGRFVQAIDGVQGDATAQRDWIFFVNGLHSEVGAADVDVGDGDRIWWDYERWGGCIPSAALGHAPGGLLHALGSARANASERGRRWTAMVGSERELRKDAGYAAVAREPLASGAVGAVRDGTVHLYDGDGLSPQPRARAVAYAVRDRDGRALVVVTGLDDAAAQAAARAIAADTALVERAFGVAFDGAGRPVGRAGSEA